jgi:hypothetical protein
VFLSSALSSSRLYLHEYSQQLAAVSAHLREITSIWLCQLKESASSLKENLGVIINRIWYNVGHYAFDIQEKLWLIIQWLKQFAAKLWEIVSQFYSQSQSGISFFLIRYY